jgi:hypothetical protein
MANNTTVTMEFDEDALRAVVMRHKGVLKAVTERALDRQHSLEVIGTNFYQAALADTQRILNDGVQGANQPRKQLRVRLPGGRNVQVAVDWKPLSMAWRENKRERALGAYNGKLRSIGPRVFWLDTGELRTAFAGWVPGKAGMTKSKPRIRHLGNGDFQIDHPLVFKKLSPAFLDQALRRALIAGAAAGRRGATPEPLRRTSQRGGIYRAFLTEVRRPTMRPLAIRLGKAMQEQMIKILRRR